MKQKHIYTTKLFTDIIFFFKLEKKNVKLTPDAKIVAQHSSIIINTNKTLVQHKYILSSIV